MTAERTQAQIFNLGKSGSIKLACPNLDTLDLDAVSVERRAVARERDHQVRELERQHVACWSEMAALCQLIEEMEDWKVLGFESYNRWLLDAAPQSRSAMYAARGLLKELQSVPKEQLREIPLGSAKVLALVPRRSRTKGLIAEAKKVPREFKAHVQDKFPELHIESSSKRSFEFTRSQEKLVDDAIQMTSIVEAGEMTDDNIPDEEAVCIWAKEYTENNRPTYEKIKKAKHER